MISMPQTMQPFHTSVFALNEFKLKDNWNFAGRDGIERGALQETFAKSEGRSACPVVKTLGRFTGMNLKYVVIIICVDTPERSDRFTSDC